MYTYVHSEKWALKREHHFAKGINTVYIGCVNFLDNLFMLYL